MGLMDWWFTVFSQSGLCWRLSAYAFSLKTSLGWIVPGRFIFDVRSYFYSCRCGSIIF
jgi:hypothetical protein